ncbi:MAG: reverse gyrase [Nitrososphaerota archaeon]
MNEIPYKSIYKGLCPNCKSDISDAELLSKGICNKCLPISIEDEKNIYLKLKEINRIGEFAKLLGIKYEIEEFFSFFKNLIGSKPWALQEVWAKRVLLGRSFSIVAPTGMGKTIFGLIMALYLSLKGKKCYIIVPSSLLVKHLLDKTSMFIEKINFNKNNISVIGYYSGMPKNEAKEIIERINNKDFSILITTDRFLYTKFDILKNNSFDFIFVDDIDSFLKSYRNIDKIIYLMGFKEEDLKKILEEINTKKENDNLSKKANDKVLVVSGATLKGKRTKRIKIFRRLFGFEFGYSSEYVRNISNFYIKQYDENVIIELIKKHGSGCLLFVPQAKGLDYAIKIADILEKENIKAYVYKRMDAKLLEKFVNKEYDVLIGVASSRSPLARGIDLPETIRYVIFAGVPRREIRIEKNEYNPQKLLIALKTLSPLFEEKYSKEAIEIVKSLSKIVPIRKEILEKIMEAQNKGIKLEGFEGYVLKIVKDARTFLEKVMSDNEFRKSIEKLDVQIKIEGDTFIQILPDVNGYIQASGRASRLYSGGITHGVSIVIIDDQKAFQSLTKRLQLITDEEFEEYEYEKVQDELKIGDEDRRKISLIRKGMISIETIDLIKSVLIIVESPTKARTIAHFFGKPTRRKIEDLMVYEVASEGFVLNIVASGGHVFDLTTEEGFHGVLKKNGFFIPIYTDIRKCKNCGEQFTDHEACPECGSKNIFSKMTIINALRKLAFEVNKVFIATDPDAEGEKIAYDLYVSIKPYCKDIERLEFHEITRKAFKQALSLPRDINSYLVNAQIVRRIEDRWVGFELSRKLWEKFKKSKLSAGRVQTSVLGWIIKRSEELRKKIPVIYIKLENGLATKLINPPNIEGLIKRFKNMELLAEINEIHTYDEKIYSLPPYTTDSLLKDAAQKLGFKASYTMALAQNLFECGLITYHRTDSTTVSTTGLDLARRYIEENYSNFYKPREYKHEGAHECIRPTKPLNAKQLDFYIKSGIIRLPQKLSVDHLKLYEMIFRRFIASQMREALVSIQEFTIKIDNSEIKTKRIIGIKDSGFLIINPIIRLEKEVKKGTYKVTDLLLKRVPLEKPYREGDIIATMKEKNIGRPSTYSKIIEILFKRNYIIEKNGMIFNTKLGEMVYEYLYENFTHFASEELTRKLEATLDEIENGKLNYQDVLKSLYDEITTLIIASH